MEANRPSRQSWLDTIRPIPYPEPMRSDVIILGGGASGLFCGLHAAARGRSVTILDHADRPAKKVLASGGGRCNFTNLFAEAEDYICTNPHFVKSALARFTPYDALDFFARCGINSQDKDEGQLFSKQGAKAVAQALENECRQAGCKLVLGCTIASASRQGDHFKVMTDRGTFSAGSLVLALGGPSWPSLGATDLGARMAKSFGLKVLPARPALVPLKLDGKALDMARSLSGLSQPVRIASDTHVETGDLLFTHRGLSGPAVLQLSSHWTKGQPITIDFLTALPLRDLLEQHKGEKLGLGKLLSRHMPSRLPPALLDDLATTPVNQLNEPQIKQAETAIHAWTVIPSGTEGMKKAEVAAGGIDTAGISSKTMEAMSVPGLFAIGEVLDVAGRLGGYNLQWAWASAYAAAQYV